MAEEHIRVEEEVIEGQKEGKIWTEEISVAGEELVAKVRDLLREGAVRKITVKNEQGKTVVALPLYAGVAGVAIAGPWTALALVAAWVARFSILVEREKAVASEVGTPEA